MFGHDFWHRQDRLACAARRKRRAAPIHAYVGPNGSGKSYVMIYDTLPSLERGRPVLSTVRLLDYNNPRDCEDPTCTFPGHPQHGQAHPLYIPFHSYEQLLEARDCDVLMDEIQGIASSREHSSMPVQVASFLMQLRRRNIALRWSTPNWARADKIIREVTQAATLCSGSLPEVRQPKPGEPQSLWTSKRLFIARSYDAALIDDFDARGADLGDLPHFAWQMLWRPGANTMNAYETLDPVLSLGWANEAGLCLVCGGKRTVPRCSCPEHQTREPRRQGPPALAEPSGGPSGLPDPLSADCVHELSR